MHPASLALVALLTVDFMSTGEIPLKPAVAPITQVGIVGDGELTVGVEDAAPVGSVPKGAARVPLLTLNLSASCQADVEVREISIRHAGLGGTSDITGVYLLDSFRRISRSTTFDQRSGEAILRLRAVTIPKCEAARYQVVADFSRTASTGGEHGVVLKHPSDIVSSAKTTVLQQAAQSRSVATSPTNHGAITVNFLSTPGTLRYGRIETVARMQLSANAKGDHLLKRVTFTNEENARDMDFINFWLETSSGQRLTPTAQRMKGYQVTLEFDPTYLLKRSQTIVLLLKAEKKSSLYKRVRFTLQEESDLEAMPYRSR